jgi:hypothetical protein
MTPTFRITCRLDDTGPCTHEPSPEALDDG